MSKISQNVKNDENMLKLLKVSSTDQKVGLNVPISVASLRLQNHKFGPKIIKNHQKLDVKKSMQKYHKLIFGPNDSK